LRVNRQNAETQSKWFNLLLHSNVRAARFPRERGRGIETERIRQALCGALVALGLLVLAGWAFDVDVLKAAVPGMPTMKVNTALCFLLAGIGLAAAGSPGRRARRLAAACGIVIAAAASLTLAQYLTGLSLGIDELFIADRGRIASWAQPGRMSPLTAMAWLAMGSTMILLGLARRRSAIRAGHLLVVFVAFIAFMAAAGYAFGADAFAGIGRYAFIALHTAGGLIIAAAAALLTRRDEGWLDGFAQAPEARRLLLKLFPLAIALPIGLGLLLLFGSGLGLYNAAFGFALFVPAMTLALVAVALRLAATARTGELALRASEARQRAIIEGTPECVKMVAADGRLLHMNPAGLGMIEADDFETVHEADVFALVVDEHRDQWQANHARVVAGESLSWEFDIIGLKGTRRSMETHAVPLRLPDGSVAQLATTRDVSERRRAEERRHVLINELNHRVKNTLAIVQSLAQQSFKGSDVPAGARTAFESRLAALAKAHDLLTRESWEAAPLRAVVLQAVAPAWGGDAGRLEVEGPELWLNPQTVVAMTLAIHELATNAMKYGALSADGGRVAVRWSVGDGDTSGPRLRFTWKESGGPTVAVPKGRGFGSRLIERSLAAELRGKVALDYRPEGLVCTIDAPVPE
jgi:PAS domain S-box-containing protein